MGCLLHLCWLAYSGQGDISGSYDDQLRQTRSRIQGKAIVAAATMASFDRHGQVLVLRHIGFDRHQAAFASPKTTLS